MTPQRPAPDEAWIGLGTNLGDRDGYLAQAALQFADVLVEPSPVYETAPWGLTDQPWFLNAVLRLRWTKGARGLLARCLAVEKALGRVRGQPNGPRTIDIDVLVTGPGQVAEEGLRVPHPGIATRRSVLEPWADLAPDLLVPGLSDPLQELRVAARLFDAQVVRLWPTRIG